MSVLFRLFIVLLAAFGMTGCFGSPDDADRSAETEAGTAGSGDVFEFEGGAAGSGAAAIEDNIPSGKMIEFDGTYLVLAEQLKTPWSIALDGDTVYISEREGSIVRISPDGEAERKPVRTAHEVTATGEAGFLGIALSPDFAASRTIYAYHTYEQGGRMLNRVILLAEKDDAWEEVRPLIEGIPGARIHDGGRIAIGPDGHLYVTTGDAGQGSLAQNRDSLAGKILRMALDGSVPEDNPFPNSYVYAYGLRNPQGIAWTADGTMYASDHGPSGNPGGHDEINRIEAGGDYGWPDVFGDAAKKGALDPLYHSGKPPAIAPSGMAATDDGKLLLAALRGETLFLFDPASPETLQPILTGEGRLRDAAVQGKYAYVITNNTDGRGSPRPEDDRLLLVRLTD